MDWRQTFKTLIAHSAVGASCFYLGVRYAGGLAIQEYIGSKPDWVAELHTVNSYVLALAAIAVVGWLVLDIQERGIDL